jgi:outer membrane protein assembly factor BamB
MEINRINQELGNIKKIESSEKQESIASLPSDNFVRSENADPDIKIMENIASVKTGDAGDVLFSGNAASSIETGMLWSHDLEEKTKFEPVFNPVSGDTIVIVSENNRPLINAYDKNGAVRWKFDKDTPICTPALDKDGNVYFYTSKMIYSLDKDGNKKWSYYNNKDCFSEGSDIAVGQDGTVCTASWYGSYNENLLVIKDGKVILDTEIKTGGRNCLLLGKDGTLYISADKKFKKKGLAGIFNRDEKVQDCLMGIDPKKGKEIFAIHIKMREIISGDSNVIEGPDGNLYVCNGWGTLTKFNPKGKQMWEYNVMGKMEEYDTKPRARIIHLPCFDEKGNAYLACDKDVGYPEGYLICLDSKGNILWKKAAPNGFSSSPKLGPHGNIYVYSWDRLKVYNRNGKNISEFETGYNETKNFAVGDKGEIYLNTNKKLIAFQPDLIECAKSKSEM